MKSSLILIILLFLTIPAFAQFGNETITITTYYPSPYGVYKNLQLYPSEEPTVGVAPGVIYFNRTEEKLYIYKNSTAGWVPVGGDESAGKMLVNSVHTQEQCTSHIPPGTLITVAGSASPMCRFDLPACPTGWQNYLNWSTTVGGQTVPSLGPYSCGTQSCPSTCSGATVTGHSWSNTPTEGLSYRHALYSGQPILCCQLYPGICYSSPCMFGGSGASYYEVGAVCGSPAYATVTQIGCY